MGGRPWSFLHWPPCWGTLSVSSWVPPVGGDPWFLITHSNLFFFDALWYSFFIQKVETAMLKSVYLLFPTSWASQFYTKSVQPLRCPLFNKDFQGKIFVKKRVFQRMYATGIKLAGSTILLFLIHSIKYSEQ